MRIVMANLRLFYQHRSLWVVYVLFGCIAGTVLWKGVEKRAVVLMFVILVPSGIGALVGGVRQFMAWQMCLFCLPRPRDGQRTRTLLAGLVVGLVTALVFVGLAGHLDVPERRLALITMSVLSVGLTGYLMGNALPLAVGPLLASWGLADIHERTSENLCEVLIRAIVGHPVGAMALAAVGGVMAWRWLDRVQIDLRHHPARPARGGDWLQRFFISALDKAERRDAATPWTNRVLLERVRRSDHAGVWKHVWSVLYVWLHPRGGGQAALLGCVLWGIICSIIAWYMPSGFIFCCVLGPYGWGGWSGWNCMDRLFPVYSTLFTGGGRRERSISTMVLFLILGMVFTFSMVTSFIIIDASQSYLPESKARTHGWAWGYHPVGLEFMVLATALLPLTSLVAGVFDCRARWRYVVVLLELVTVFFFIALTGRWMMTLPLAHALIVVLVSWGICAAGVYRTVMRGDLIAAASREKYSSW